MGFCKSTASGCPGPHANFADRCLDPQASVGVPVVAEVLCRVEGSRTVLKSDLANRGSRWTVLPGGKLDPDARVATSASGKNRKSGSAELDGR